MALTSARQPGGTSNNVAVGSFDYGGAVQDGSGRETPSRREAAGHLAGRERNLPLLDIGRRGARADDLDVSDCNTVREAETRA